MIVSSENVEFSELNFDVCVIGAGVAGITLARALGAAKFSVGLFEAGDKQPDESQSKYYHAPLSGIRYDSHESYGNTSRLRFLGGTSNHWTGYCAPLTESDFQKRAWIENSGWPISWKEVYGHMDESCRILEIAPFDRPKNLADLFHHHGNEFELETQTFHLSPPVRFGEKFKSELDASESIHTFLNSTFIELSIDGDPVTAKYATFKTRDDRTLKCHARVFVLCCGGIENARLLLDLNQKFRNTLGNQGDSVGRYFSDHLNLKNSSRVVIEFSHDAHSALSSHQYSQTQNKWHALSMRLRSQTLAQQSLPNFLIGTLPNTDPASQTDLVGSKLLSAKGHFAALPSQMPPTSHSTHLVVEPPISASNRVELSSQRDPNGTLLAQIKYSFWPDYESLVRQITLAFARQWGAAGLGIMRIELESNHADVGTSPHFTNLSCHHLCTTRMSDGPKNGCVDADQKLFGTSNFFVGGSSVFSTPGVVNPTFTIVAMTLRLAETLKRFLRY